MIHSLRRGAIFLGCLLSCATFAQLFVDALVSFFGSYDETDDYLRIVLIFSAILLALWVDGRFETFFARRRARRVIEEGWITWTSQRPSQKSALVTKPDSIGKKVA